MCGSNMGDAGVDAEGTPDAGGAGRRRRARLPPLPATPRLPGEGGEGKTPKPKSSRRRRGGGDATPKVVEEAGGDGSGGEAGAGGVDSVKGTLFPPLDTGAIAPGDDGEGIGEGGGCGAEAYRGVARVWVCRADGRLINLLKRRSEVMSGLELVRAKDKGGGGRG